MNEKSRWYIHLIFNLVTSDKSVRDKWSNILTQFSEYIQRSDKPPSHSITTLLNIWTQLCKTGLSPPHAIKFSYSHYWIYEHNFVQPNIYITEYRKYINITWISDNSNHHSIITLSRDVPFWRSSSILISLDIWTQLRCHLSNPSLYPHITEYTNTILQDRVAPSSCCHIQDMNTSLFTSYWHYWIYEHLL